MATADTVDRMTLAEQCRRVTLRPRYDDLAALAVDLHLVANDGSGERYHDGRDFRDRARQGYRAELAVAQYYDLRPEIDYRPPGVGDPGRDFWARYDDAAVTIDVKATTTDPPRLYLTKKRHEADRYTCPDYYLLASGSLTDGDAVHLVGWAALEEVLAGRETEVYGNPVWVLDATDLHAPPGRGDLSPVAEPERLRLDAARLEA
jgi:hypothetical protein